MILESLLKRSRHTWASPNSLSADEAQKKALEDLLSAAPLPVTLNSVNLGFYGIKRYYRRYGMDTFPKEMVRGLQVSYPATGDVGMLEFFVVRGTFVRSRLISDLLTSFEKTSEPRSRNGTLLSMEGKFSSDRTRHPASTWPKGGCRIV